MGEAIELGAPVELLVACPDLLGSAYAQDLVTWAENQGIPVVRTTEDIFQSITFKQGPQGLGAVVQQRWTSLEAMPSSEALCWVALDRVADPGNLGSILRTADAVGAAGVILVGPSTDPYCPIALRASMGAIFSQSLIRADLSSLRAAKLKYGWHAVGTSDAASVEYSDIRYSPPLVLFMGSEREGLGPAALELCDEIVRIPMVGRSDSLNLSVATGVMLYQMFQQRRGL